MLCSQLPLVEDKNEREKFWFNYNKTHAMEHQDMANWINALAKAKSLDLVVTYYQCPPVDHQDKKRIIEFFEINWKQHMLFYDYLNKIGKALDIPVFTFPRNYPSWRYDLDFESFLKLEKEIHDTLWRAIDLIKGG